MGKTFQNLPNEFDPKIIKQLLKDRKALIAATQRDFFLFFYVYTWFNGLKRVQASVATSILLFGSVITTLLNFIFIDKILLLDQVIGTVLIIGGVMFFAIKNKDINFHKIFSIAKAK